MAPGFSRKPAVCPCLHAWGGIAVGRCDPIPCSMVEFGGFVQSANWSNLGLRHSLTPPAKLTRAATLLARSGNGLLDEDYGRYFPKLALA